MKIAIAGLGYVGLANCVPLIQNRQVVSLEIGLDKVGAQY